MSEVFGCTNFLSRVANEQFDAAKKAVVMSKELQDKVDAMILAAARKELSWSADDPRPRDHAQWKRDLLKQLRVELSVSMPIYT